ncbi:MAG: hypothetical protein H6703_06615 [Myxococcales bacterium]|nr:hypothetical protein [Myxococcales bacterium]
MMFRSRLLCCALAALAFIACDDDDAPDDRPGADMGMGGMGGEGGMGGAPDMGPPPIPVEELSIAEYAAGTCFTAGDPTPPELLDGLSRQLVAAIDCVRAGTLGELPPGNWRMLDPIRPPLVDARGVDDLIAAAASGDREMVIRWAYRDVAVQHLFYLWTLKGCDFAAPPGLSNHQNGLSVDLEEPAYWSPLMRAQGWEDNLPTDRPHFDYVLAEDVGLARLSLFAFQALHNRNRPDDPLPLTGEFDAATEVALGDAIIGGFATGLCDGGVAPPDPPMFGGPTVAQAAWRGCEVPVPLVEGLGAEIAAVMACAAPEAVATIAPCGDAGCLAIAGPPKPEWLERATHDALVSVSAEVDRPLAVAWGGRDVGLVWYLHSAQGNLSCPGAVPFPSVSPHAAGRAVELAAADAMDPAVQRAMAEAGFVATGARWVFAAGADLRPINAFAFQVLWNHNRPDEPIPADGRIGPETLAALDRAPIGGFGSTPCEGLVAPPPGMGDDVMCVEGCFNQTCAGTYEFCDAAFGMCAEVACDDDLDCGALVACDDPARASRPFFMCEAGRCRRSPAR